MTLILMGATFGAWLMVPLTTLILQKVSPFTIWWAFLCTICYLISLFYDSRRRSHE